MPSVETIGKFLLKRVLLFGSIAFFLHYSYTISRTGLPPSHVEHAVDATVQILDENDRLLGSGFIINRDGIVVTAGHLFLNHTVVTPIFVKIRGSLDTCQAKALASTLDPDMAVLQLDRRCPIRAWIEVGRSDYLVRGEKVHMIGHPSGIPWSVNETEVSSKMYVNGEYRIVVAGQIIGGSSGGPVVDRRGKVIGMVISSQVLPMNPPHSIRSAFTFALPGTDILRYLEAS